MNTAWTKHTQSIAWLLLISICMLFFHFANRNIENALPYPTHIDEKQRLNAAKYIIQSGDLNPNYFHKPSFHIYLTVIGMSVGYLKEASHGKIRYPKDIGSVDYPYYSHPEMIKTAKQVFVLFSTLALFLTGYIAYKAYRFKVLIILPALLLPFSEMYQDKTSESINVNILGAFFVAAMLAAIFNYLRQPGSVGKAIVPGILCGMVISSKYNFIAAYLPCFLTILLYERQHWLSRSIVLLGSSFLTIIVLNPYFILDIPNFLEDVGYQVNHYLHRGHRGYEGDPGVSQFNYYLESIIEEFGLFGFIFSLIGLGYMLKLDWKKTLIFASFPIGMLLLMSASKANFLRNLTPVYVLWPIFISMGMIYSYKLIGRLLNKHSPLSQKSAKYIAFVSIALLLVTTLPFQVLAEFMQSKPDSRNQLIAWINTHAEENSLVLIPSDLEMDVREFNDTIKLKKVSRQNLNRNYLSSQYAKPNVYLVIPDYGLDKRYKGKQLLFAMEKRITEILNSGTFKPIKTFGSHQVLLNYYKTTAEGDPKFYLAKYQHNEK